MTLRERAGRALCVDEDALGRASRLDQGKAARRNAVFEDRELEGEGVGREKPAVMGAAWHLGLGCVLIASMLVTSAATTRPVIHELLITLFVVMTAPVTAMTLARAAIYRRDRRSQSEPREL